MQPVLTKLWNMPGSFITLIALNHLDGLDDAMHELDT